MVLVKLGLTYGRKPEDPYPETENPPVPADPVSPLDEAIRQLEQLESEPVEPDAAPEVAMAPGTVPEDVGGAVAYWLPRYSGNPTGVARNIRELAAKAPERVVESLLQLLDEGRWGDATPFLARLMSSLGGTAAKLCDPEASLDGVVSVARVLMQYEPRFDALFAKSLLDEDQMTEDSRQRGLAVLAKLDGGGRLIPILMQFLRDPEIRIRSKAAMVFGQIMPTQGIMERLMRDPDARVRANFIEGLWKRTVSDCRPMFRQALEDSHHRVVGNALVGLHRLGEARDVVKHLGKMVRRPEPLFRGAAAWVMGQTGETRYIEVLRVLARDGDPMVRRSAYRSLRQINSVSAGRENPQPGEQPGELGDSGAA